MAPATPGTETCRSPATRSPPPSATASTSSASTRVAPVAPEPDRLHRRRDHRPPRRRGSDARRRRRPRRASTPATNSAVDVTAACIARIRHLARRLVGTRNVARDVDRASGCARRATASTTSDTRTAPCSARCTRRSSRHRVRTMVLDSAPSTSRRHRDRRAARQRRRVSSTRSTSSSTDCAASEHLRVPLGRRPAGRARGACATGSRAARRCRTRDGRRAGAGAFYLALIVGALRQEQRLARARRRAALQTDRRRRHRAPDPRRHLPRPRRRRPLQQPPGGDRHRSAAPTCPNAGRRSPTTAPPSRSTRPDYPILGRLIAASPIGCDPRLPAAEPRRRARRRAGHRREPGSSSSAPRTIPRRRTPARSTCSSGSPAHGCLTFDSDRARRVREGIAVHRRRRRPLPAHRPPAAAERAGKA